MSSNPANLTALKGKLLFNGFTLAEGDELWVSDGLTSGTMLVKDIFPGPMGSLYPGMTAMTHSVVFAASNGLTGVELWKSNGEGVGTIQVQEIVPGPGSSTPVNFTQGGESSLLRRE